MFRTPVRVCSTLLGLVAALGLASACQSASGTSNLGPDVWASVDGRQITKADVEKAYRSSVDPTASPSEEEVLGAKLNLLDELINQDILETRAKAANLVPTDAEVDNAFNERKRSVADADFNLQLAQRGLSVDDLKASIRRELTLQKLMERDVTAKVNVTDDAVAAFYEKNKSEFTFNEPHYRLGQIGVTPVKDPNLVNRLKDDAGSAADAKRKVDMLMAKLKAGEDFGDVALDYSEDPQSLAQGGDLGFVPGSSLAQVSPSLRDAVMRLEPGAVNLVTTGNTYTILLLIAKEPAGQRPLASVRDSIRNVLQSRREEVLRAAYVSSARNGSVIVNNLAKLVADAPAGSLPNLMAAPAK
jgi:peptidyl-prolyl cis-trans isomerase SurA